MLRLVWLARYPLGEPLFNDVLNSLTGVARPGRQWNNVMESRMIVIDVWTRRKILQYTKTQKPSDNFHQR